MRLQVTNFYYGLTLSHNFGLKIIARLRVLTLELYKFIKNEYNYKLLLLLQKKIITKMIITFIIKIIFSEYNISDILFFLDLDYFLDLLSSTFYLEQFFTFSDWSNRGTLGENSSNNPNSYNNPSEPSGSSQGANNNPNSNPNPNNNNHNVNTNNSNHHDDEDSPGNRPWDEAGPSRWGRARGRPPTPLWEGDIPIVTDGDPGYDGDHEGDGDDRDQDKNSKGKGKDKANDSNSDKK